MVTKNENNQAIKHRSLEFRNKANSSTNKKKKMNHRFQFEGVASEIIYDDIATLNPTDDVLTTLEEVVT